MEFNFEKLDVWKISLDFAGNVYELTKSFPRDEVYGLTSQVRRAAVSITANIAEGKGRYTKKDFRNFLYMARGSLFETITHLRLSRKLKYIDERSGAHLDSTAETILRKLSGLIHSLEDKVKSEP